MIESSLQYQLGSERGWRELTKKLRPFVRRRVNSDADVDDILQDIFLKLQRGLGSVRDDQRFGAWVYRVARSAVIDHQRASARHPVAPAGPGVEAQDASANEPDANAVSREVAMYAAFFVSTLPSPYREALTLTELEGLSQREAAERTGVSLSGMKSRVQRGRQKLRNALEDCCQIALDARRRVVACEPRTSENPGDCCS